MRIVIDTNVVASAIFFGGRPRDLMEKLLLQRFEAYASPDIINEYKENIFTCKFACKFISVIS